MAYICKQQLTALQLDLRSTPQEEIMPGPGNLARDSEVMDLQVVK